MHRLIMNPPIYLEIDHINHDGLDNRKKNLRLVTRSNNNKNRRKRNGTLSRYKGVSFDKRFNKWIAYIRFNGRFIFLGYFKNEKDAALIYNQSAEKYFGEYAHINFLE